MTCVLKEDWLLKVSVWGTEKAGFTTRMQAKEVVFEGDTVEDGDVTRRVKSLYTLIIL